MFKTGSITCPLHDCAFSIKAFIMPCAVYMLGNLSVHFKSFSTGLHGGLTNTLL